MRFFRLAVYGVAAALVSVLFISPSNISTALAAASADVAVAKGVYDTLFAAKLKAVGATPDRVDDLALAKEMVALAISSENQPQLIELICDGAYELSQNQVDGFSTAVEAMRVLADAVPVRRGVARERLILTLNRQMATGKPEEREGAAETLVKLLGAIGDEKAAQKDFAGAIADYRRAYALTQQRKLKMGDQVKTKLDWAMARDRTAKQFARLQEKLLANANDQASAQELVRLCMFELDDPAIAVAYLERANDAKLTEMVPLAAKSPDELGEKECLALGEWYFAAASDDDIHAPPLLLRAQRYLARFLELHATVDIHRTKAAVFLKETEAKLAARKIVVTAQPRANLGIPGGNDAPVNWSMRLWGGSHFVVRAMTNLDTNQDEKVFTATNPERIKRKQAILTNEQSAIPADVDFELAVRVSGKGLVGLLRSEGLIYGLMAAKIDSPNRVVVSMKRQAGKMTFAIDGKPVTQDINGKQAGPKDGYVFAVELHPNDTIHIHDFRIKINN